AHAEILPEHWLLKLLEQGEGDLTVLARRYEWDMDGMWQALLGWLDQLPHSVRPILRDHFQPALLARFQTVIYRPLAETAMRTIVEMKLGQVRKRLHRHYGLTTHIESSLYDALTSACLLPDTGARNVDSLLNQQILPVLSQQLLSHMAAKQKPVLLTMEWSEEEGISLAFDGVTQQH
ncbi:MAG: hypothetical protein RSD94_14905, partial [Acinetobacter sp.]